MKMTSQEIRIIATGPWKIYDFKIEVVPFIINFRTAILCFYQDMLKDTTGVNRSRK